MCAWSTGPFSVRFRDPHPPSDCRSRGQREARSSDALASPPRRDPQPWPGAHFYLPCLRTLRRSSRTPSSLLAPVNRTSPSSGLGRSLRTLSGACLPGCADLGGRDRGHASGGARSERCLCAPAPASHRQSERLPVLLSMQLSGRHLLWLHYRSRAWKQQPRPVGRHYVTFETASGPSEEPAAHRWLAKAEADDGRAILRRSAVAHQLDAGAAVAKGVDARGSLRGRWCPAGQGRCSGGWRRTRPSDGACGV